VARPDDRLLGTPQTAQEGTDEIIRSQQVRDQIGRRLREANGVLSHVPSCTAKMQATIEFISGYVRRQVCQLDLAPPASYVMQAHLIPSYYLDCVAATQTVTAGEPPRALAEHLRRPLFEPDGALGAFSAMEQNTLKAHAATLAEVFQRSSSNVEGRNGYLSLRNHQPRGLDHPRKQACLTAVHNFLLTRSDGTTAAERFFR
jgi:Family of unknown function (DUF6399)